VEAVLSTLAFGSLLWGLWRGRHALKNMLNATTMRRSLISGMSLLLPFILFVVLLWAVDIWREYTPGAYVDMRSTSNIKISLMEAEGARVSISGRLATGSWDGFACLFSLLCGQTNIETKECGYLTFNEWRSGIYCIHCREGNIHRELLSPQCPLQDPKTAKAWADANWKFLR
jgi:hypothetical protein